MDPVRLGCYEQVPQRTQVDADIGVIKLGVDGLEDQPGHNDWHRVAEHHHGQKTDGR